MPMADESPAAYEVLIVETGERFGCRPGESVLKAMERLDRRGIPVGCRGGGCGVCRIRVRAGSYTTKRMSRAHVSEDDEARGIGLACCVLPAGRLELSVLGQLRKALWPGARGPTTD